jgi:DNA adenine methylase
VGELCSPCSAFDPFSGGLAVFLAKPPSDAEVINDFNGDLVNLYRYAQFHLEPLLNEVQFTLTSRADLDELNRQPGITGLQRAARYQTPQPPLLRRRWQLLRRF